MKKVIYILLLFAFFQVSGQTTYYKEYFENGKLKAEGWLNKNQKVDYWFYYFENGNKKKEGHFKNNKKCKWWIFYNPNDEINKKCEFKNDQINGFSLFYRNNQIIRAEKYVMGKKIKEWNSLTEFKKDNNINFL
ncbi:MAG: antitoxin component YwqK of YwqJK toxin-antitoxin module [Flavobacterium sp.]